MKINLYGMHPLRRGTGKGDGAGLPGFDASGRCFKNDLPQLQVNQSNLEDAPCTGSDINGGIVLARGNNGGISDALFKGDVLKRDSESRAG